MKTIDEIRHANLLLLIQEHGLIGDLNEKIGLACTDATLSQIRRFTPGTAARAQEPTRPQCCQRLV